MRTSAKSSRAPMYSNARKGLLLRPRTEEAEYRRRHDDLPAGVSRHRRHMDSAMITRTIACGSGTEYSMVKMGRAIGSAFSLVSNRLAVIHAASLPTTAQPKF